jgi:hypothetical protein
MSSYAEELPPRPEQEPQSPIPNWRPALDPIGAEASILKLNFHAGTAPGLDGFHAAGKRLGPT